MPGRRRSVTALRFGALIGLLLVVASLVGCGDRAADPSARLTILAVNTSVGRAAFHLECAPDAGDLANPARACAAIAAQPELVTSPKPFTCIGGRFSWWEITITGRLHGRAVRTHTSSCWTPQMAMIDRLGIGWQSLQAHLLARRHETIMPGTRRTFLAGLLRPADLITCRILGHKLEDGVPIEFATTSVGYGGRNVISVVLRITHEPDGSVTASCGKGNA